MIDIDHFKLFNDTHGHPIGDEVLVGVSKIVADRAMMKGRAYRYGGEEITLLLPNYTADEGVALAETIRRQIEQSELSGKRLKVTASLGLAASPEHAKIAGDLLKAADAAMYEAKRLGRNLVRVFGEHVPAEPQRAPARKSPAPGALSDDDRERIRTAHFSGGRPECPKDGTKLRILSEFHEVGRRTPSVIIMCPVCGLQEIIDGLA
jgi:diguanylate cyclase (GGDEF)-like protein